MSPSNPFPARRASDRSQLFSMCSLEWRLQKIGTSAGAQNAQIVGGRAPRVSMVATPETESRYR
eukprot:11832596-Alexandrium_andersonii.AAC.1